MFFSVQPNRGADEKAEERVVTADIENLKWETVEKQKPEDLDLSSVAGEMATTLKELTPHARYAVFTREVVSKGEAKTSKIHYFRVSPGSELDLVFHTTIHDFFDLLKKRELKHFPQNEF